MLGWHKSKISGSTYSENQVYKFGELGERRKNYGLQNNER